MKREDSRTEQGLVSLVTQLNKAIHIIALVRARGLVPFADLAYQGFGDGIEGDGLVFANGDSFAGRQTIGFDDERPLFAVEFRGGAYANSHYNCAASTACHSEFATLAA